MNEPPYLSVTQMKTYLRCPLQYFFRYVCGVKPPASGSMALGRAIHETLRDAYRQKIETGDDMPEKEVAGAFESYWEHEAGTASLTAAESGNDLKEEGLRLLQLYEEKVAPEVQPVEVEREFLIDTGATDLPLKGYIDLIDDQSRIIDHKTAKRSLTADAVERDIQLSAYALAYRTIYGEPESSVRLDVMVRTKEPKIQQLASTRTDADIARFQRLAEQVERGIRSEVYFPNENMFCNGCQYGEMCNGW